MDNSPMKRRVSTLLLLLLGLASGQATLGQDVEVRDTKASVTDSLVTITYGLVGQEGEPYDVGLLISTGEDETSAFRATAVSGNVGEGVQAGEGLQWRQIQWRYRERFPEGLPERVDYEVVVREQRGPEVSGDFGVRNVSSSRADGLVTVTYDLIGERDEEYQVTLLISASGGEAFDYEPKAVSGDVGEGVKPGSGRRIRWRYREDFPDGLQRGIRYRVKVQEEGGNGWLYALGSAVVVGGGATAAAFLTGLVGGDDGGGIPRPPHHRATEVEAPMSLPVGRRRERP